MQDNRQLDDPRLGSIVSLKDVTGAMVIPRLRNRRRRSPIERGAAGSSDCVCTNTFLDLFSEIGVYIAEVCEGALENRLAHTVE